VCDGQLLLGNRSNEPLKGYWFTPGGRIHKNETWQNALSRIAEVELGFVDVALENFSLMGIWDHFYSNSAVGHDISTHYVNLPHYIQFKSKPEITLDDQHRGIEWFDLSAVANYEKYHPYMRNYANWILNKMESTHD
jgi:colanic acid biosynthesis protein WcaH